MEFSDMLHRVERFMRRLSKEHRNRKMEDKFLIDDVEDMSEFTPTQLATFPIMKRAILKDWLVSLGIQASSRNTLVAANKEINKKDLALAMGKDLWLLLEASLCYGIDLEKVFPIIAQMHYDKFGEGFDIKDNGEVVAGRKYNKRPKLGDFKLGGRNARIRRRSKRKKRVFKKDRRGS